MSVILKANDFIKNSYGFCVTSNAESCDVFEHSHDFYEIAYITHSYGSHHSEQNEQNVHTGNYVLLSPEMAHYFLSKNSTSIPRMRVLNCLFTKDFFHHTLSHFISIPFETETVFHQILKNNQPFCLILQDDHAHTVISCVNAIQNEYRNQTIGVSAVVHNHLENILLEVCRHSSDMNSNMSYSEVDYRIDELNHFMKQNLDLQLSLDILADHVHLSPEYLSRYFKKHTGKNIIKHLTELRIDKAKELLQYTTYSVSEICFICGFSSESNFRKYFNQVCGISPSTYKKTLNKWIMEPTSHGK